MYEKVGDFSNILNTGGAPLNRSVRYVNNQNEITICGYRGTADIRISFNTNDQALRDQLILQCRRYNLKIDKISLVIATSDKTSLAKFLNIIDELSLIGNKIKKEIFDTLELKQIPNFDEFLEELKNLIKNIRIQKNLEKTLFEKNKSIDIKKNICYLLDSKVLEQALSAEDENLLYLLGKYCEEISEPIWAIEFYKNIPKENPHYYEANYASAHLAIEHKIKKSDLLREETNSLEAKLALSLELSCMLEAAKTDPNANAQRLVDQLYHTECGCEGLVPDVEGVAVNEETLAAMAEQKKLLLDKCAFLEKKLAKS